MFRGRAGGPRGRVPLLLGGGEWVGGRVTLPMHITEDSPDRPECDIWLELPSGLIVGWRLFDPKAPQPSFADSLRQAMAEPHAGPARRPARVRVRDAALARDARAALGDETEIVVAPTPELDDLVRLFAESLPEGDEPEIAPYGAWPLLEDDLFQPEPARGPVPPVGRNEPCPCGSGKKYKKCHLGADSPPGRAPIHDLDRRLAEQMMRYAQRRFGDELLRAMEDFDDAEEAATLSVPWSLFHFPVRGRPVVEWFLEDRRTYLAPNERSWLKAQARAWISVWEVQAVEPGESLTVLDLLTGERRTVREASASRLLAARDAFLGRVTDHDRETVLTGSYPRPLPPFEAAEVVRRVRSRLHLKRAVPIDRLRAAPIGRYLIDRWEEAVDELEDRRSVPPMLQNTDGDELLLTTDRFGFDPAMRSELEARISAMEGVEPPQEGEEKPSYAFLRAGNEQHPEWENTVLGTAWVSDGALKLETNSLRRADALRARLRDALGDLVRHRARDHTDPRALFPNAAERGEPKPLEPPSPEAQAVAREWKERHYARWIDTPLPALDGHTAREAVRTARDRERVDVLLKDLENREARRPAGERFDFGPIRRALGL